jgi:cellulose synthase operon protein C
MVFPRALLAGALSTTLLLVADPSHAASAAPSQLPRLVAEAKNASEPESYTALRTIWQSWDYEEPALVDAALLELSKSPSLRPASRTYAGLLHAYARRRFGDVAEAQRLITSLGFVSTWAVVGPFDNEGKHGFDMRYEVENKRSFDFSEPWPGKERSVRYRLAPNVAGNGWLDLGAMLRPQENICAYATTLVHEKSGASKPVTVWAGSAGALKVFFNGREVIRDNHYRSLDADRFSASVTLEKGWNRVLAKVCGAEAGALLTLRIAGADGAPDASL